MSDERIDYDPDNELIRVYRSFSKSKTLVPKDELRRWGKVVEQGEDDQGRSVQSVRYVFDDKETAKYNQQSVAFNGLETYVESDGSEKPLGDDPDFSVREDFGIEGSEEQ